MPITDYTTYESIRAVLGVDDDELSDARLALPYLSHGLDRVLASVSGVLAPDTEERTLAEHYAYITSLQSPTSAQSLFAGSIESYATYYIASAIGSSISLAAPKTKSDGKALVTRFSSEATFKDVIHSVSVALAEIRSDIYAKLGIDVPEKTWVSSVPPSYDPVTNV